MYHNGHLVLTICVVMYFSILSNVVDASHTSMTMRRARTMTNWVYFKVPRIEALVVKVQGRALHPGDMSCWKNLMSLAEFSSGFLVYFPTARKGSTYSLIIYSDVEVFYVRYGIVAESVFRGVKGPDSSVNSLLVNFFGFKKIHVTLFEENPQRPLRLLDPSSLRVGFGLHALETLVSNTFGIAGKLCMELLADGYKVTSRPRTINHEYQKSIDTLGNGWFSPRQE
ncbi:uncharacterized protein LOC111054248 [Nilaparvata lugens]|uniref:uncharacterized protein LOC111054248 n=1 Tax=Nilaparvata lugens TaxID=108931 RepID=UPI00193E2F54|nr:uncharacterized protein LOC111054248 [Nilaparvata lugens]